MTAANFSKGMIQERNRWVARQTDRHQMEAADFFVPANVKYDTLSFLLDSVGHID